MECGVSPDCQLSHNRAKPENLMQSSCRRYLVADRTKIAMAMNSFMKRAKNGIEAVSQYDIM